MKKLLTKNTIGKLILQIVILLAIPYAYLMLCGLVFDKWLHMYNMTVFIFVSLCVLYLAAIVLSVLSVIWYRKAKK